MTGTSARKLKDLGIPNLLSILRLILIPAYVAAMFLTTKWIAAIILVISGLTDVLDGIIARNYHMVTELGRILDPLADKLTQATVCVCLVIWQPSLVWLLAIFVIKELAMIVAGANIIHKGKEMISSRWFGKLATVVFYVVMVAIILFQPSRQVDMILIAISLCFMLFSFIMYIPIFFQLISGQGKDHEKHSDN